ncbi:unnamed protein product, partial [Ectocarpus sp. 12 AP-2014]
GKKPFLRELADGTVGSPSPGGSSARIMAKTSTTPCKLIRAGELGRDQGGGVTGALRSASWSGGGREEWILLWRPGLFYSFVVAQMPDRPATHQIQVSGVRVSRALPNYF